MYPFTVRCILQFVLMALSAQVALTTSLTSLFNESLVAAANFSRRKLISLPLSLPHITHELKNKWTNLHVRDASGFLHTCMCKDTHAENKLKIKIIFTNAEVSLPTHSSTEQHRPLQVYVPSASLFHIVFSCTVWWLIFLSHVSLTLYSYVKWKFPEFLFYINSHASHGYMVCSTHTRFSVINITFSPTRINVSQCNFILSEKYTAYLTTTLTLTLINPQSMS